MPVAVIMHCLASRLRSWDMSAATVWTQYRVLGFRSLKVHGAFSPLRLQATCKQKGCVAEPAGSGVWALLHLAPDLPNPTTYLLDQHVPFVQVQLVPQLQQHSVNGLLGASFPSIGSERHDDIDSEDVTVEQPGQPGGSHNGCREGKRKMKIPKTEGSILFP